MTASWQQDPRVELIPEDEMDALWKRFVAIIRGLDRHAAELLATRCGDGCIIVRRPFYGLSPSASEVPVIHLGMDVWVEDGFFDPLCRMRPLIQTAAVQCGLNEFIAHDSVGDVLQMIVRPADERVDLPTRSEIAAAVEQLARYDPFTTTTVTRPGFTMTPIEAAFYDALSETQLLFTPQCRIVEKTQILCRVDVMVYWGGRAVAVELDGSQFHTSKQAHNKDTAQDRFLAARGIQTLRFTGSQIKADPRACIFELVDCLKGTRGTEV